MKLLFSLLGLVLIASSCTNADPDKMAGDVCDCMDPALSKLSSKSKKIVIKAFKSGDVQNVIQEELQKLDEAEERNKVQSEITKAGTALQNKKMQTCLNDIDKKYKVLKSKREETQQAVYNSLKEQCEAGAYIFKYSLDQKANTQTSDDETEETPKRKTTTEEEE